MPRTQFLEWLAYFRKYGFPDHNADGRTIDLIASLYNVNKGKKDKPVKLTYFTGERFKEEESVEDRLEAAKRKLAALR